MLGRLFPAQFDNHYQGSFFALVLLVPIVLVKLLMGFNVSGLNPWISSREILETVDRFSLAPFDAPTANHILFLFASWGLFLFLTNLLAVLVIIRYRAMVPLIFLLLFAEQGMRMVSASKILGSPLLPQWPMSMAGMINWGLTAALFLGFLLSLQGRHAALAPSDRQGIQS